MKIRLFEPQTEVWSTTRNISNFHNMFPCISSGCLVTGLGEQNLDDEQF